jgi:hypothetical protein
MLKHQPAERSAAVEKARQHLRGVAPIPWYEFQQTAIEVLNANPSSGGPELVDLIMEAVVKQWATGTGCC